MLWDPNINSKIRTETIAVWTAVYEEALSDTLIRNSFVIAASSNRRCFRALWYDSTRVLSKVVSTNSGNSHKTVMKSCEWFIKVLTLDYFSFNSRTYCFCYNCMSLGYCRLLIQVNIVIMWIRKCIYFLWKEVCEALVFLVSFRRECTSLVLKKFAKHCLNCITRIMYPEWYYVRFRPIAHFILVRL